VLGADHPDHVTESRAGIPRIGVLTLARNVGTCYGGAERIAFEFVKRLDPERFTRRLCVTHAPPDELRPAEDRDMAELDRAGVQVVRLECRSLLSNVAWARVYSQLTHGSIDILHAHMPRASVPGTILGRLARVPVIVNHEHSWSFQGKPVRQFLDRNVVARGSDVLLAVSEWDRSRMVKIERIPPERIRILPNGIASVPQDGRDLRGEFGASPEVGLIGAVGRLYPEKGYDDLVRAIALLKQDSVRPIRCVIVGHGSEREKEKLQALINELDVAHEVRLVGRRQDVPDVIRALDVAVLSSRNEGSPLAMMEYMAGAAPIVATAVGGIPELVEDGVHGLLVPPHDPNALAAAIRRLLADRTLALRLGDAARERQRSNYDLDAVVGRLERLYVELYERSRAARGAAQGVRT
jgi:glycosyltransferase involved in cell wall biosynthesis